MPRRSAGVRTVRRAIGLTVTAIRLESHTDDAARVRLDDDPDARTGDEAKRFARARRQAHLEGRAGLDVRDDGDPFASDRPDEARQHVARAQAVRFLDGEHDVAGANGDANRGTGPGG